MTAADEFDVFLRGYIENIELQLEGGRRTSLVVLLGVNQRLL